MARIQTRTTKSDLCQEIFQLDWAKPHPINSVKGWTLKIVIENSSRISILFLRIIYNSALALEFVNKHTTTTIQF